jgi:NAD-dependent SIR2 family protein deacetylase
MTHSTFALARTALHNASAVVLATGAGMGVDSGLPDFRGATGFWKAYPMFERAGLRFHDLATPYLFETDPTLAWGFYGHRFNLYRDTVPHAGHAALLRAIGNRPSFAYTSNVDGQLLKAGWSPKRLVECHGRIRAFQCLADCGEPIWDASDTRIEVDPTTCRAVGELPTCPSCGGLARPNILMFMDGEWDGAGTDLQHELFENWWFSQNPKRTVVIECGAGTAIPSVRRFSEQLQREGATLIRINPRESEGPRGTLSLPCGAAEGLHLIA